MRPVREINIYIWCFDLVNQPFHDDPRRTEALALAIVLGGVALIILLSSITIQCDRLGQDYASVIRYREVSLVRRSGKYTFLWLTVWDHRWPSV